MLKVKLSCPICGQPMFAKSIEGHLEKVHELTGVVTLRLHPTSSYLHEPEAQGVELAPPGKGEEAGRKAATATTPEPEAEIEPEVEPEPAAEIEPEAEPEPKPEKGKSGKKSGS